MNATAALLAWTTNPPYFSGAGFNAVTGTFTVPSTGIYLLSASCDVKPLVAATISVGAGTDPALRINRTSPTAVTLASAEIPILNVNVALVLNLRTPVYGGLHAQSVVSLAAGDVVQVVYDADGLTTTLDFHDCRFSAIAH